MTHLKHLEVPGTSGFVMALRGLDNQAAGVGVVRDPATGVPLLSAFWADDTDVVLFSSPGLHLAF